MHESRFLGVEPLVRYITIKLKQESKEEVYRNYVCNCLKVIAQNTAKQSGGTVITKSYFEIVSGVEEIKKKSKPKTAEQVVAEVMAKGGLKLNRKGKEETV